MMLLDSNILIYAALGQNDALISFVRTHAPFVSDISRVEVLGFHKIKLAEISFLESFFESATILPITNEIIIEAIRLRQLQKMALGDVLIAATALEHDLDLITRSIKDFKWIEELTLIDPFEDL